MRTRIYNGKEQIFCEWRKRWVRLTPEEWVRQQLLHRLVEDYGYPASLIAVEQAISVGETKKRCDAVVYTNTSSSPSPEERGGVRFLSPLMIIECKAETVPLSQKTLDQAASPVAMQRYPGLLCTWKQYLHSRNPSIRRPSTGSITGISFA